MEEPIYKEIVKLLTPGTTKRLTLVQAVTDVMRIKDPKVRLGAVIVRDHVAPIIRYEEIAAIHARADFPRW